MFENLRVVGLGATVKYQSTTSSFFDPRTYIEAVNTLRHPPVRDILSGFSGVVRPGEMLRTSSSHPYLNPTYSLPTQSCSAAPAPAARPS